MPRAHRLLEGVLLFAAVIAVIGVPLAGLYAWPFAVLGTVFVLAAFLFAAIDAAQRARAVECCAAHARSSRK